MILRVFLILGLLALPLAAQESYVTVGKSKAHPTHILARYAAEVSPQSASTTLQALGLRVKHQYRHVPGLVLIDVNDRVSMAAIAPGPEQQTQLLLDRIQVLRNSGSFAYVEPDFVGHLLATPTDAAFLDGRLWGLRNVGQNGGKIGADIDAVRAWDLSTGGTNVIIAVMDSGIRYTHRDLAANMWVNPGETQNGIDDDNNGYVDDIHGINAVTGSGNPMDDNNHGTHVAGTIGAVADNGFAHVGVNWTARLMAVKIGTAEGFILISAAIEGSEYATDHGARIQNHSWGGYSFSQALLDSITAARDRGVLWVVAAGNERNDNDELPAYPASYDVDNIISVAALDRGDRLAGFSNFGATAVDIGAPGAEIFSTIAESDTSYAFFAGTSMASPHVAGVAGLILGRYPTASLEEVRARILLTAVRLPALQGRAVSGGRVNAFAALDASPDGILEVSVTPESGAVLLEGMVEPIFVRVNDLFPVTNATVNATVTAEGLDAFELNFVNNGQPPDERANDGVYSANLDVPVGVDSIVLTVVASAPDAETATNVVVYTVVPPPPNDDFVNASKIPAAGGTVISDNRFATLEPLEPMHAGIPTQDASLWWKWSPGADGPVVVDTAGSTFDTVLAVYTGSDIANLDEVASVDDVFIVQGTETPLRRLQGYVTFDAQFGVTYHIVVSGYDPEQRGTIRLRVEPGGGPDLNNPVVNILSPRSGMVVSTDIITVSGSAFDPQPNASGLAQVNVLLNQDPIGIIALGTTNWTLDIPVSRGVNTIEAVAIDNAGNISEPKRIQVDYRIADPSNDAFGLATELTGTSGQVQGNNENATRELDEPFHAGNEGGKSVWWRWTAPEDGLMVINTENSSFDTLLAVYTGTAMTNLVEIAANDDAGEDDAGESLTTSAVSFGAISNEVYYVAVDGYGGVSGSIELGYSFTAAELYELTLSSTSGGSVSPASGRFAGGTSIEVTATADSYFEFLRWEGDVASEANPLPIVVSSNMTLHAVFRSVGFADDFETGDFSAQPWTSAGNRPWVVQTNIVARGGYAAKSGAITHGQRSSLVLSVVTAEGTGAVDVRVSSERKWDWLEFYVNNNLSERWSGNEGWLRYEFQVAAGTNTFEWRYVKDASFSDGLDAAYIDNLSLPFAESSITLLRAVPGGYVVELTGQSGQVYTVEASEDLRQWTPIAVELAVDGVIRATDTRSASEPARFYRAYRR
jgi:subtilisin family serine protease